MNIYEETKFIMKKYGINALSQCDLFGSKEEIRSILENLGISKNIHTNTN